MKVPTIGLDLAQKVLQIHGIDPDGKPVLKKRLALNYLSRKLRPFRHALRLMSPPFVTPSM